RQTLAAGHTILPNVTANDPALLTSTKAFVAELEAVAPSDLAGSWKVLGSAVLTFVQSGGDSTKVQGIDAAAVRTAASTVAADAMVSVPARTKRSHSVWLNATSLMRCIEMSRPVRCRTPRRISTRCDVNT